MNIVANQIPEVMTAKELADFLKLSPVNGFRTIQKMAREKKIKGTKVGDLWRFSRENIVDFMRGGRK